MSGSFKKSGTGTGVLKASLSVKPPKIGVPVRAKLPGNKTGTLQFTRTLLVSPFTKTNIAGAVANAVNYLDYTPVAGDAAYNIGVDATTTAATMGGAAYSPVVSTVPATMAAPTLTAGVAVAVVAFTAPSDGGSAILDYDFMDSSGKHTTLTGSGQSVPETAGSPTTGQIRARNANGYGAFSPQSNSVTPTAPTVPVPTVTNVPVITGTPTQGVPLSITAAVFAGTVDSTAREVWRVNTDASLTQVFSGTTAQTYTPVAADVSATGLYVRDTATNSGGTTGARSTTTTIAAPAATAPTVTSAAAITGTPTQNVPLTITAAVFGGSVTSTARKVWRVETNGALTQVFSGTTAQTYAPVAADAAATGLYVVDSATGAGGTTVSQSPTRAVTADPLSYSTNSMEGMTISTGNAVRVAMTNAKRQLVMIDNPASNVQGVQYVLSVQANQSRNVPTSGWVDVPPGGRNTITGADATAQIYTRIAPAAAIPVTAASSSGLVATVTVPNHGIALGATGPAAVRSFENIVPAKYNMHNINVTVVDANTLTYPILATTTVGTAFGVMFNGAECFNVTTGEIS